MVHRMKEWPQGLVHRSKAASLSNPKPWSLAEVCRVTNQSKMTNMVSEEPLALLEPISTVLHSSEEPSIASESDSTLSTPMRRRTVTDEESLNALLLRFEELHGRVQTFDDDVAAFSDKKHRPSKRQRRSLAKKKLNTNGFEGPILEDTLNDTT